jgi:MoxR-like ATPase
VLTAVVAGGHILLEDVPGVGKTTLAMAIAAATGGVFRRTQCTADLLPGDITGVLVMDGGALRFRPGPLFANVMLADEINRTPPRTQSALLEAMGEGAVTVDGETHLLPRPFMVLATQNPHDHAGTWPLPESQLDRFLIRLSLGYPGREEERAILRHGGARPPLPDAVVDGATLAAIQASVDDVHFPPALEEYLLDVVSVTRRDNRLVRGVSPRGARALHRAARALALVRGRAFVIPEDVRQIAVPVLAHRVVLRQPPASGAPEAAAEIMRAVLADVRPPR